MTPQYIAGSPHRNPGLKTPAFVNRTEISVFTAIYRTLRSETLRPGSHHSTSINFSPPPAIFPIWKVAHSTTTPGMNVTCGQPVVGSQFEFWISEGECFFYRFIFLPFIRFHSDHLFFHLLHSTSFTTMPLSQTPSQSSLQVPGQTSTRTLRPPSPARKQPGLVPTLKDSCITLTRHSTPESEEESPNILSHRPASPRPPVSKKASPVPKAKGKVSLYVWYWTFDWRTNLK